MTIEQTLDERHGTYGSFAELASVAHQLRTVIFDEIYQRQKVLAPDQEEALTMICSKIARIVNGNHNHIDSWHDIAGYAQLVADRLRGDAQ